MGTERGGHMRLIDGDAIYKQVEEAEELAQDRVIDTKETLPFQNHINPAYTRYLAQVGERTWMKHMIANAPTVDAVPVVHGEWLDGYATQNGKVVYKSIDCSVCEEYFKIESYDREYWKARFKVCPFCGAKMDGGKANDER